MNRGWTLLVALGLGGVAYGLTQEAVVGLLVAATGFWLLNARAAPREATDASAKLLAPPRPDRPTELYVVCKRVTAERQEWASVKTGRIFEVTTQNGPARAKAGDEGEVVSGEQGHYIVRRSPR